MGYRTPTASEVQAVVLAHDGREERVRPPMRLALTDSGAVLAAGLEGLGIVQISSRDRSEAVVWKCVPAAAPRQWAAEAASE